MFEFVLAALLSGTAPDVPRVPREPTQTTSVAEVADPFEASQRKQLLLSKEKVGTRDFNGALALIDDVINKYEQHYPDDGVHRVVVQGAFDALVAMAAAATADESDKTGAKSAVALMNWWAEAYFYKGYVLVEAGRADDALPQIEHAISLAPYVSRYQSELGQLRQDARNWDAALDAYSHAAEYAMYSPESERNADLARAKRGTGFVYIEQGRIDDAEKLFLESLKLDPADLHARNELDYIQQMRQKTH